MTTIQSQRNDVRSRRWLICAVIGSSLLIIGVAALVAGETGTISASLSVLACGAPAVFCFAVSRMLKPMQVLAVSTIMRMAFALALAVGVKVLRPEWGVKDFYGWLLVAYMIYLGIDTLELLRSNRREVAGA